MYHATRVRDGSSSVLPRPAGQPCHGTPPGGTPKGSPQWECRTVTTTAKRTRAPQCPRYALSCWCACLGVARTPRSSVKTCSLRKLRKVMNIVLVPRRADHCTLAARSKPSQKHLVKPLSLREKPRRRNTGKAQRQASAWACCASALAEAQTQ